MTKKDEQGDSKQSRSTILNRRARFVGLALASAGVAMGSEACVCLSVAPPPTEQRDAGAQPCLSEPAIVNDASAPVPCLSHRPPADAAPAPPPGVDAGTEIDPGIDAGTAVVPQDAGPGPIACLDPQFPPTVCLSLPIDKLPKPKKQ